MKSIRVPASLLASCFAVMCCAACNRDLPADTPPGPLTAGWTTTRGISGPESVYVDPGSGFIFSSQIVGWPDRRDGNGRIVKLTGSGAVVSSNWVRGLNAPKGLRSCSGTLWTADIDEVIGIEIASGTITSRVTVPGAQMLNDVACSDDGTVYVSDWGASKIIAVKDGTASVFAEGEDLEWPNGLLVEGGRLVVGGWGKQVLGRLYSLDLQTKQKTLITPAPVANIDGIESDGQGGFVITDYIAGKILHVSETGDVRDLRTFSNGTADLAFVADKNIAIVPHMNEDKLVAYDLSEVLK